MKGVLTFDIYGTLAAWDETLATAFAEALPAASPATRERAVRVLKAESRRLQTLGAFRPYVDILRDSADLALTLAGGEAHAIEALVGRMADVPPHSDVPPVLRDLAEHYRLVAISNSDDGFLSRTLANLGDVWDGIVTAEQACAYKPNPELFRYALERQRIDRAHHVHVAQGMFSDLAVCAALGIDVIWINRRRTTLQRGLVPIASLEDLVALGSALHDIESASA